LHIKPFKSVDTIRGHYILFVGAAMSVYTQSIRLLNATTISASGSGDGINLGEYLPGLGTLFVYTHSRTASSRFKPRWQFGPIASAYTLLRGAGTYLSATGLSALTFPNAGAWGRVAWDMAGTSTTVSAWVVLRGQT
jgi:hypothetical protein